jgi:hypothetical protein
MKKDVPLCINFLTKKTPYKGPSADSEEKHEPVSDIDTGVVDSLKALDHERPIREADSCAAAKSVYSITSSAMEKMPGGTVRFFIIMGAVGINLRWQADNRRAWQAW